MRPPGDIRMTVLVRKGCLELRSDRSPSCKVCFSALGPVLVPCQPLPGILREKIVVRNPFGFRYVHGYSSPCPPQLPPRHRTGKVRRDWHVRRERVRLNVYSRHGAHRGALKQAPRWYPSDCIQTVIAVLQPAVCPPGPDARGWAWPSVGDCGSDADDSGSACSAVWTAGAVRPLDRRYRGGGYRVDF